MAGCWASPAAGGHLVVLSEPSRRQIFSLLFYFLTTFVYDHTFQVGKVMLKKVFSRSLQLFCGLFDGW